MIAGGADVSNPRYAAVYLFAFVVSVDAVDAAGHPPRVDGCAGGAGGDVCGVDVLDVVSGAGVTGAG